MDAEFVEDLLRFCAEMDDDVWPHVSRETGELEFLVNCNDTFWWATADGEEITRENLPIWKQSAADLIAICPICGPIYDVMLFCSRVRKMRIMKAAYPDCKKLWPLFDAAGPERPDDHTTFKGGYPPACEINPRLEQNQCKHS